MYDHYARSIIINPFRISGSIYDARNHLILYKLPLSKNIEAKQETNTYTKCHAMKSDKSSIDHLFRRIVIYEELWLNHALKSLTVKLLVYYLICYA